MEFSVYAFNKNFTFTLKHATRLLQHYIPVYVRKGEHLNQKWTGEYPDCFMNGVTSRRGRASLSYCGGIVRNYIFEYNICHVVSFSINGQDDYYILIEHFVIIKLCYITIASPFSDNLLDWN